MYFDQDNRLVHPGGANGNLHQTVAGSQSISDPTSVRNAACITPTDLVAATKRHNAKFDGWSLNKLNINKAPYICFTGRFIPAKRLPPTQNLQGLRDGWPVLKCLPCSSSVMETCFNNSNMTTAPKKTEALALVGPPRVHWSSVAPQLQSVYLSKICGSVGNAVAAFTCSRHLFTITASDFCWQLRIGKLFFVDSLDVWSTEMGY